MLGAGEGWQGRTNGLAADRRHLAYDRALDRPTSDRSLRFQNGAFLRDRPTGADGMQRTRGRHPYGFRVGSSTWSTMDSTTLAGCLLRARGGDDFAGNPWARARARSSRRSGRSRSARRVGRSYGLMAAMKSRKASTTRRLASSVPMVMRRAWAAVIVGARAARARAW